MSVPEKFTLISLDQDGFDIVKKILKIDAFSFEAVPPQDITQAFIRKMSVRKLSFLRHGDRPDVFNSGGFVLVYVLLDLLKTPIEKVVFSLYAGLFGTVKNDKHRFQFGVDATEQLFIRASQGHSGAILEKLNPAHIYSLYTGGNVFHRTTPEAKALIFSADILSNGLRPIGRLVHMAMEEDRSRNADKFPVKITVDVAKARTQGITFYLSANNVVLSYDPIPLSCLST